MDSIFNRNKLFMFYQNCDTYKSIIYDVCTLSIEKELALNIPNNKSVLVKLLDGNILIIGSYEDYMIHSKYLCNIYNLNKNILIPVGNMIIKRNDFSAIVLPNGNVFISGGKIKKLYEIEYSDTCEIFDITTQTFTLCKAKLKYARCNHTSNILSNGKVFICGGSSHSTKLNITEIYDIEKDLFEESIILPNTFSEYKSISLKDGKVLIYNIMPDDAKIYDSRDNSLKQITLPLEFMTEYIISCELLSDGCIIFVDSHYHIIIYNPFLNTLSSKKPLNIDKCTKFSMCNIEVPLTSIKNFINCKSESNIIITHGFKMYDNDTIITDSNNPTIIYDIDSKTIKFGTKIDVKNHTSIRIDNKIFICDNYIETKKSIHQNVICNCMIYDIISDKVTLINNMILNRKKPKMTKITNNNIFIAGGYGVGQEYFTEIHDTCEIYNLETNKSILCKSTIPLSSVNFNVHSLSNNRIFFVGNDVTQKIFTLIYNIDSDKYTKISLIEEIHDYYNSVSLLDGRILIYTFCPSKNDPRYKSKTFLIYNPTTNKIETTELYIDITFLISCICLSNGNVALIDSNSIIILNPYTMTYRTIKNIDLLSDTNSNYSIC